MNIFVLDRDPDVAARAQCDKHVIKMCLETAQLLCSVFPAGVAPYRLTHAKHPCSLWTRQSRDNFLWLVEHGLSLCSEYTVRYGKEHRSKSVIEWASDNVRQAGFEQTGLTPFAQAMPEQYKHEDAVLAYRAYYRGAKVSIATWKSPAAPPAWWTE